MGEAIKKGGKWARPLAAAAARLSSATPLWHPIYRHRCPMCTYLSIDLSDRTRLQATAQDCIERITTSGDGDELAALLHYLLRCCEAKGHKGLDCKVE